MRDIPMFVTDLGVANLILNQIPYTQTAYIRIQDCQDGKRFLEECAAFCRMAGAEKVFATGHSACEGYPRWTGIVSMQAPRSVIGQTDACLFPVTEKTIDRWREIYNQKVTRVPNGAWMTETESKKMLRDGSGYFIHRDGVLLGIGKIDANQLQWVASVYPGGGEDSVKALCSAIPEDFVTLEVADTNEKAVSLYSKLGFVTVQKLSQWYQIK